MSPETSEAAPTVSVALCTYNGERWLPLFLDSLLAQTRPPAELIVNDDDSHDATLELLDDFANRAPFPVNVVANPQRLGSTMNFGAVFARCSGALIAPADQDDVWAPAKLGRLTEVMDERGLAMAFSDGHVINEAGKPVGTDLWGGVGFSARRRRQFERDPLGLLLRRSVVTGAAMMFRAEYLDRLLPFPGALNGKGSLMLQDRWIALVLAAVAEVAAVGEPLISFRHHADQQTGLREPVTAGEVARQLRRTTASSAAALTTRADQLAAVLDRVRGDAHPGEAERISAAVAHLRVRASLSSSRAKRLPVVGEEWVMGRYRRYSGGVRSAIADSSRPAR